MPTYTKIKKLNLFKEAKEPGSRRPDYGNSKVIFEVALLPGRYSFSGWQYEDTGNISLEIQRVTEDDDPAASYTDDLTEQGAVKHNAGDGGFDD
jgi:hypothetical protein